MLPPNLPSATTSVENLISHKFLPINEFLWKSLEKSEFHFSAPHQLNDPADCQIDLKKAFQLARKTSPDVDQKIADVFLNFLNNVQEKAKTCGIFSLCSGDIEGEKERLLWAHYAKNHTGVCLTFEIPITFVTNTLVGCAPVRYNESDLLNSLRNLDFTHKLDFETEIKQVITAFLTTKAPEWSYEKESRLISYNSGLQSFDRTWLKQICFGIRAPQKDRDSIKKLAEAFPNCGLAEITTTANELFKLQVQDYIDSTGTNNPLRIRT